MNNFFYNYRKRILWTLATVVITCISIAIAICNNNISKNYVTIISVVGSMASIYGIVDAIIRIRSVAKEQTAMKSIVNKKVEDLDKRTAAMTLNHHTETCEHAIEMVKCGNIEATLIHLKVLRDFFIELENIPSLSLKNDKDVKRKQISLKSDLSKLRNIKQISELDAETISSMIDRWTNLQDYISRLSCKLKYEGHEE